MYDCSLFDKEYFEQGPMTGKSLYTNYRWLPELTLPLCHHIVKYCGIQEEDRILDFGCAKGYTVLGLRMLGYEAYGVDVSKYAISQAPKEVNGFVNHIEPFEDLSGIFGAVDWVLCKDILEHLPYDKIDEQLQIFVRSLNGIGGLIIMVPLGDGEKYYIDAYEKDVTHIIRENLQWWTDKLTKNGLNVEIASNDMGPFKKNWQIDALGNGLFLAYCY